MQYEDNEPYDRYPCKDNKQEYLQHCFFYSNGLGVLNIVPKQMKWKTISLPSNGTKTHLFVRNIPQGLASIDIPVKLKERAICPLYN